MKPRMKLRLVPASARPLGPLSRAEKLVKAIAWLRGRRRYVLDPGTPRPKWGTPHQLPAEDRRLLGEVNESDRRRK